MEQGVCPTCHQKVLPTAYFCPNCGTNLKAPPPSVSVMKQIGIYSLSFFLPPLGLVPGIKYITHHDRKVKMVGFVAVGLTVLSIVLTFVIFAGVAREYSKLLNSLGSGQYVGY